MGFGLEKLIDVLQLEGHELFRIFIEVQGINAICNGVVILFGFIGLFLGAYVGYRCIEPKENWNDDDFGFVIVSALVGLVVLLIFSGLGTHIYMHLNYPEYFAAKELIFQIGQLTP